MLSTIIDFFLSFKLFYWFYSKIVKKHHIVDCRCDEYQWGYCDIVSKMLYANFNMLKEFVEKEKPFDVFIWNDNKEHQKIADEIFEIYEWWKYKRKEEHKLIEEFRNKNLIDTWFKKPFKEEIINGTTYYRMPEFSEYEKNKLVIWEKMKRELELKDQKMLEKLVKIREHLWT